MARCKQVVEFFRSMSSGTASILLGGIDLAGRHQGDTLEKRQQQARLSSSSTSDRICLSAAMYCSPSIAAESLSVPLRLLYRSSKIESLSPYYHKGRNHLVCLRYWIRSCLVDLCDNYINTSTDCITPEYRAAWGFAGRQRYI